MYSESQTKLKVRRDSNGDTRHATHIPTISEFNTANQLHRSDVKKLIERFCALLTRSSDRHDWSKIEEPYRSMFYRDMVATMEGRMQFEDGEWPLEIADGVFQKALENTVKILQNEIELTDND